MKLIRNCTWEEVFLTWYKNEGNDPHWNDLARERGFANWADWRINGYARQFELEKADWGFYEIDNPAEGILNWHGGPFRTWIEKYYADAKTKTFAELSELPDLRDNPKVKAIVQNYPAESIITALELSDGRMFVVEGMHRACALAMLAKEGKPGPDKLIFAIGRSRLTELPPVGQNTSK